MQNWKWLFAGAFIGLLDFEMFVISLCNKSAQLPVYSTKNHQKDAGVFL